MAFLPQRLLRLTGFNSTYLNSTSGSRGEIYYDNTSQCLRIMDGSQVGGFSTARADLVNVSNATFAAKASAAGITSGSNSFSTISVAGQNNVVADVVGDTLALVAGAGISITTNSGSDAITINSTVIDSNTTYSISAETGQAGISLRLTGSDTSTDNVYLEPGANIEITRVDANKLRFSSTIQQFSGDYADLANKPNLQFSIGGDDSTQRTVNLGELVKFIGANGVTTSTNSEGYVTITGPTLAAVASSGSYVDLNNKPSIPAAYSATSINALSDVDTTSTPPTPGQVLKWNGTNWAPGVDATVGGAGTDADTLDGFDSTYFLNYFNQSNKPTLNGFTFTGASVIQQGTGIAVSTDSVNKTITVTSTGVTELNAGTGISLTGSTGRITIASTVPAYSWNIAADDSTQRAVTAGELVKFVGANGITTSTDTEGYVTITAPTVNSFSTILISGQSNVVADSTADTLTLVAGSGISITTDAGTDTVTITNSSPAASTFSTIAVSGQSNVVADSTADTLTLVAGTGISITTDASTDTVTITGTVSSGSATYSGLTEATTASSTIDKIINQATIRFEVTNFTSVGYYFTPIYPTGVSDYNPSVYIIPGTTVAFNLNCTGHPFLIQNDTGGGYANYNTGLVHVTTSGVITTGASAQGKVNGTLYWSVPYTYSGTFRYICSIHSNMTSQFVLGRGQTAGSTVTGYVKYNGTTKTDGQLYGGTTAPTNTTRLNFDGNLHATNLTANQTTFNSSGGSGLKVYGSSGTNQWDLYLNGANLRFSDNTSGGRVKIDTGLTIDGSIESTTNSPLSFISNSNTGTYNRTVLYANQNNTSNSYSNGIFIERGRLTDSNSAEIRSFVIGSRGGEVQLWLNKDGNLILGNTVNFGGIINASRSVDNGTAAATDIADFSGSYQVIHNQDNPGTGNKTGLFFAHAGSPGLLSGIASTKNSGTWQTNLDFYVNNLTGTPSTGVIQRAARITSVGNLNLEKNLGLGAAAATTSGTGITFPATQSASTNANTLDDYEEGTFTPAFAGTLSNPTAVYGQQTGSYVKIGNTVFFNILIIVNSVSAQGTGGIQVSGLPFSEGGANYEFVCTIGYNDVFDTAFRAAYVTGSLITIMPVGITQGNAQWNSPASDTQSNLSSGYFAVSGFYYVA